MTLTKDFKVSLVDLSGEARVAYTPLGVMLLRAALLADEDLAEGLDVSVHAFLASTSLASVIEEIQAVQPDLLGFSCQGWNVMAYRQMLPTLRQLLPDTVIVFGGNHVSHQGDRWLRELPELDLVITGEGERTICELVASLRHGDRGFADISGLAFRQAGSVVSTADRPRMASLDEAPSAYLQPGLDLARFDVALWETNRGCPYHCSFCHWGGAVGQRLTKAASDRLEAELDIIGRSGVGTVFLCDANFGILRQDVDVAHMLVRTLKRHGAPHTVHVNWAKNHAATVEEILTIFQESGVHTNVYLALQTMSRPALKLAGRSERGRPEMTAMAQRVIAGGGHVGAELIFGLPGETLTDFRAAYDELFLAFPSLLIHPLWILPNTTYDADREKFNLITIRPDPAVDYEGVLQHSTLSIEENRAGLRLLLADEILIGSGWASTTVRALARWGGTQPTTVLDALPAFVASRPGRLSRQLARAFEEIHAECYFHRSLRSRVRSALFTDPSESRDLLLDFLDDLVADAELRATCRQLALHDTALLPRADLASSTHVSDVDSRFEADFDTHDTARSLSSGAAPDEPPRGGSPVTVRVRHPAGFADHLHDAIDLSARWVGRVIDVSLRP
ncbi:cobalamin-dependent protein [Actinocorallia sp. API 0066]|uniref:B12-binding domain-containing radical SAM protein n=1 Tax=Actinocorallia sp. API 0066 TaxID=2896846 RepID=UPI001E46443F|nr:cobalamin-dependent protein [Actinocorallia sp. API 0066]MCD0453248.1 cobalamin-dependent protein [Actinocorallia sp. API 0066]